MIPRILTLALVLSVLGVITPAASQADDQLDEQAHKILKNNCYSCHGSDFKVLGFDILDYEGITQPRVNQKSHLTPGSLEDSKIWIRAGELQDMPPKGPLASEDREILKRWIATGGKFPRVPESERPFISETETLTLIREHLQKQSQASRQHQRYFSLVHLHNNRTVSDDRLRVYRAAFSKVINSLGRKSRIVLPELVDGPRGTILNIDLSDLGWEEPKLWNEVVKRYPYAVTWTSKGGDVQVLTDDIEQMIGKAVFDGVAYIRADWFVSQASRPPLYHELLDLPDTAAELEKNQGVNVTNDFKINQLQRGGFARSGVSKHNRVVDRHEGTTRYYYRSIDFAKSTGRAVVSRFPLGPSFEGNEFAASAFEHDGSEVIWRLPNGLQGYMIVNKDGNRVDEAPISIVRDTTEYAGTPIVVNGLSCMGCHQSGIQDFEDTIGQSLTLSGEAGRKIRDLYTSPQEMQKLLDQDRADYLAALEETIGPFLRVGKDDDRPITDFPEPVTAVAKFYDRNLGPDEVAAELQFPKVDVLKAVFASSPKASDLGLTPLVDDATIPRAMWELQDGDNEPIFQSAVSAFTQGVAKSLGNN